MKNAFFVPSTVSEFGGAGKDLTVGYCADKVYVIYIYPLLIYMLLIAKHHGIGNRILGDYELRFSEGYSEALSLTYGIVLMSKMTAEDLSADIGIISVLKVSPLYSSRKAA